MEKEDLIPFKEPDVWIKNIDDSTLGSKLHTHLSEYDFSFKPDNDNEYMIFEVESIIYENKDEYHYKAAYQIPLNNLNKPYESIKINKDILTEYIYRTQYIHRSIIDKIVGYEIKHIFNRELIFNFLDSLI